MFQVDGDSDRVRSVFHQETQSGAGEHHQPHGDGPLRVPHPHAQVKTEEESLHILLSYCQAGVKQEEEEISHNKVQGLSKELFSGSCMILIPALAYVFSLTVPALCLTKHSNP